MSYVMQAILGNPNAPENGVATVSFPLSETEHDHSIAAILEPIGIGSVVTQDCFVEEIGSSYEILQCLKGQMVNVDELDYLSKRLDSFDAYEMEQFQAACYAFGLRDIKDFINMTFCCQESTVISDFSKLADAGRRYFLTIYGGAASVDELEQVDGKGFAERLLRSGTEILTPYGLFFRNGMRMEEHYHGLGFPPFLWDERQAELDFTKPDGTTAVIFLPFTELELERFLQREDIPDIRACKRTLLLLQSKERTFALESGKAELDEWNEFCDTLNIMSEHHQQVFAAALEVVEAEELSQLELLATNIDDFDLIPGIKDAKSYGRYMIQESGKYDYDESLDCYYNYEAFGGFLLTHEVGQFTSKGYLKCEEGSAFLDFFTQDSPEQGQSQGDQSMQMGGM